MLPNISHSQPQSDSMAPKAMPPLDSPIPDTVKQVWQQRHWLEWAEYVSVAGSIAGSLAVIMAAAPPSIAVTPLTVALSLNAANRYRFEQRIKLSQNAEVVAMKQSMHKLETTAVSVLLKLRQQVAVDIESVRQEIATVAQEQMPQTKELEEQLAAIQQLVGSLQVGVTSAIAEVRQQLTQQLQALSLSESGVADFHPMNETLNHLQAITQNLEEKALTKADLEAVNVRFVLIEQALTGLQNDLQALTHHPKPDLSRIQSQLEQLEQQNRELIKPYLKRLGVAVKQLQHNEAAVLRNAAVHQARKTN